MAKKSSKSGTRRKSVPNNVAGWMKKDMSAKTVL